MEGPANYGVPVRPREPQPVAGLAVDGPAVGQIVTTDRMPWMAPVSSPIEYDPKGEVGLNFDIVAYRLERVVLGDLMLAVWTTKDRPLMSEVLRQMILADDVRRAIVADYRGEHR